MKLYHFSEDDSITIFHPRVKANRQNMPPVVWAVDEAHQFTYYFPRDCPRIVYTRTDVLTEKDKQTFFGITQADIVVTLENHWYERMQNTTIYRYILPSEPFQLFDEVAGYYISTQPVQPVAVEPVNQLLEKLTSLPIDVRFTPSLRPLREAILQSSLTDFGIYRFENVR